MARTLDSRQAARIYDRIGARQDSQGFYEDAPLEDLRAHAELGRARAIVELGCGTGRLAAAMLDAAPPDCRYLGLDVSRTMVQLSRERLAGLGDRARVLETRGEVTVDAPEGAFDRYVSSYVFDLLPESQIRAALAEARRLLSSGGLLCLAGIAPGHTRLSRLVMGAWAGLHRLSPRVVGGCRPLDVAPFVTEAGLDIVHRRRHSPWGISSEVVVARRP